MKTDQPKPDAVNHPAHYTRGGLECITVIEALNLPFHLGNTLKYIWRAGHKDDALILQDLKKAQWYLNRYINIMEKQCK